MTLALLALLALAPPGLRVLLQGGAAELVVHPPAQLADGPAITAAVTLEARDGLVSAVGLAPATELLVHGAAGQPVEVELRSRPRAAVSRRAWRGSLLLRASGSRLVVINQVDLESYLRGVVPLELDGSPTVRQVQAIAARSLALARRRPQQPYDFDLPGTQAYGGVAAEEPAADAAVAATAGQVLLRAGQPLNAVYGHSCGGVAADAAEAWGGRLAGLAVGFDEPGRVLGPADEAGVRQLLAGRRGLCAAESSHRWTVTWPWATARQLVQGRLAALQPRARVGPVTDLRVARRGPSGRVSELEVRGSSGLATVRGDSIRWLFGPFGEGLKSTLFVLDSSAETLVVRGGGWGHGVGLCQMGAVALAQQGRSAAEILHHYYPDATLGPAPAVTPAS
ncbi:MAG: hypothetical protein IT204_15555 [Fimbriimonadaceae bacterium]|nr:hypothetical protein [Fimbriimonadaceae bacterium]